MRLWTRCLLRPTRDSAAMLAAILICACSEGGGSGAPRLSTRDSAGVEIAEIEGDPWQSPEWATLDTTSVFRIAADDSRPETVFGRVRGTLRLSDGRIAVLDVRAYTIRLFAADGSFIRSIGRRGQGPGEVTQPWRLMRAPGDSLAVFDLSGYLEIFPSAAEGSRRMRPPWGSETGTAQILASFADGGYLAIMNEFPGPPVPGRNPLFSTLHIMTAGGEAGATLGRHQSTEFTFTRGDDGRARQVETLFWAEPGMAVLPSGYVWCLATAFDCQVWSTTGTRVRSIVATVSRPPVTDADVAELTAMRLGFARTQGDSAQVRNGLAEADRMDRFPVLSLIRTDSRGRIWMRPFLWRPSDRVARWLVFEPTGQILGTVAMPANLQIFDIGADYVLGIDRDEDDAERVTMYAYSVAAR